MGLSVGSLFSGIGGIDLGLERAGMDTRWFVEWDAHCQNVLRRHWPGLPVYGDITAVDWSTVEPVDVLAGGFPCQPVSNAGKRLGTDDARWLWPEFARAIRALEPRYVFVENVAALLGRGFEHVITDLAALRYDAEWDCIPAAAVGAPHERDRLFLVAYSFGRRLQSVREPGIVDGASPSAGGRAPQRQRRGHAFDDRGEVVADADASRRRASFRTDDAREPDATRSGADVADSNPSGRTIFQGRRAHEELARHRAANRAGWWDAEPDVGRVAHGIPHRMDRLRALGNAVVPQVVEWIGRRIVAFDESRAAAA